MNQNVLTNFNIIFGKIKFHSILQDGIYVDNLAFRGLIKAIK